MQSVTLICDMFAGVIFWSCYVHLSWADMNMLLFAKWLFFGGVFMHISLVQLFLNSQNN